jgi:hypothetical protein
MKQREKCLGRGCESPLLHLSVFSIFRWGSTRFDRATSKQVDSTVGDDRKSSKKRKCKRRTVRFGSLNTA